ncbi:MAG: MurR/RpiR family transcriptional regulator [Sphaerochaetaceae bacterium]|jgi:DNA-binding MurR/RpiR family transcriptional regulator|nr:MurR/RpiR family transcriptional regulator [Sphaerochaetaceae bacterium]MDX9939832.1 MurR/RpiR family transcriptional regulator [Sphaerochaetaceae bacterium]
MKEPEKPSPFESGCIYTIKTMYPRLSAKERTIADHILSDPAKAVHPSIDELADQIGISESTLVRFVRKLGYSGYQRFRIALATEAIGPASRIYETRVEAHADEVEMVFSNAMNTLSLTRGVLDRKDVDKAAQMIANSGRLLIFGLGGSNIVAQDAFHKLIRTGIDCVMVEDYHMQLMLASQSCADCVALIFSHTGTNMDTIAIAQELRDRSCKIIVVTTSARSGLSRMAHVILPVAVASNGYIAEAFSARIAQQVTIDVLYVMILKHLGSEAVEHLEAMRNVIAKRRI